MCVCVCNIRTNDIYYMIMHAIPENRLLNISILWCLIFVSFSCPRIILYKCLCGYLPAFIFGYFCLDRIIYTYVFFPPSLTTVIKVVKTYIINTVSFPFRAYITILPRAY